jgi:protein-S-isoprenylcysteine O-methyltransferase Ste14
VHARPGTAGVSVIRWGAATLFFASLAFFLYTYAFTFGEVARGRLAIGDLIANLALFTVFAAHHSILARLPLRRAIARMVPADTERSFYVAVASLLFFLVCVWWRPLPGVAWETSGPASALLYGIQTCGLILTIRSAAMLDIRELSGLRNVDHASPPADFKANGPYGRVRHPIYSGWFLIVFATPVMTMTRLEFAIVSSAYIVLAIPWEERTLKATGGIAYERYLAKVRWKLVPGIY